MTTELSEYLHILSERADFVSEAISW